MYLYLLLAIVVATISFVVYRKLRLQEKKTLASSSTSTSSSSSLSLSSSSSSSPPPSKNWEHHVFVSFRGEDVRTAFLSHILKEFRRKGINPFIDNEMKRGEFINPELKRAIKGSRIAIVLLSKNYASSSWCLNELVKIIKCKRKIGQKVITIFYQVEPTNVKNLVGEFGKVFKKTCKGKPYEVIRKWKEALAEVATIAGYDSNNWVDEAAAIEEVANDISKMLNHLAPSHYLDRLIGMEAHMEKMKSLLRLDLVNEVRMIGICGPLGIGKSTISRYLFNQLSNNFQLTTLMVNIKQSYPKPCIDEGSAQLQLQNDMLSKMINHKDIVITHLGAAQDRLHDKKVLLVLDDVDEPSQLVALAEDSRWFGPGSRIIIATEDSRVLLTHGIKINHIYKVNYPSNDEALQMFCMYAFRRKFPDDGFTELAREVTKLVGNLPLGLQVMGSYFLRRPKHEWIEALPKLRSRLDGKIESILMFSYDALSDEYKDLFLHIACYFNRYEIKKVEAYLAKSFMNVSQGLQVLVEKSLIDFNIRRINMHKLLVQLGQEIVSKQSIHTCQELNDNTTITRITRSVVGIYYLNPNNRDKLEGVFKGMSYLQFLEVRSVFESPFTLYMSRCLIDIPSELRLLDWDHCPMTYWPTAAKLEFLVELNMRYSKFEKLWKGIKPLQCLKWMDLSYSKNLRKLPNFSTATNLNELRLKDCSSLMKIPSSIGNATNLQELYLDGCSSLVDLPSSLGNLQKLLTMSLQECSKLEFLPTNINMEQLSYLCLTDCLLLKSFPEISTNIKYLFLMGTAVKEAPLSIRSWSRLERVRMPYIERFMEMPHALSIIIELDLTELDEIQELGTWMKGLTRLHRLVLNGMKKLVSLPQLPDSLLYLDAENCESLERLDCSFCNRLISLNFRNCFKLNQESRDLIIQTSTCDTVIVPGTEVPTYFNLRASGNLLTVKLNDKELLGRSIKYRACALLVSEGVWDRVILFCKVASNYKSSCFTKTHKSSKEETLSENLFIFDVKTGEVTSTELLFQLKLVNNYPEKWKIKECGVVQCLKLHEDEYSDSSDE